MTADSFTTLLLAPPFSVPTDPGEGVSLTARRDGAGEAAPRPTEGDDRARPQQSTSPVHLARVEGPRTHRKQMRVVHPVPKWAAPLR